LSVAASKLMEFQPDGMFVSMNPSYKGRTELPDNLKSYFRLASMIAPNTSIIISTLLYI
jgi:dynein heavy chain